MYRKSGLDNGLNMGKVDMYIFNMDTAWIWIDRPWMQWDDLRYL